MNNLTYRRNDDFSKFMLAANTAASLYSANKLKSIDQSSSRIASGLRDMSNNFSMVNSAMNDMGRSINYGFAILQTLYKTTKMSRSGDSNQPEINRLNGLLRSKL